jgi:Melibiase
MRLLLISAVIAFAAMRPIAQASSELSVSGHGWKLTADSRTEQLRIDYDKLGAVMTGIQLFLAGNKANVPLHNWALGKDSSNRLTIQSENPRSFWRFDLEDGVLIISTTVDHAVLTASTPAPPNRQLARLMDPGGVPVKWAGTDEVHDGYGGPVTQRASYLPRRNSGVMYFALGAVSATTLHSLFDRPADTAIDLPEQASLVRNREDSGLLDTRIPLSGNAVLRIIPDYYAKTLGLPFYLPFDDSHFPRPPVVWSSWTSYYADVSEADIVRNTDWLAQNLKPYGFEYVQLDDGYDRDEKGQHYWIENWSHERFPHGPEWLAQYIKSKGLHAGIWLVPNAYAGAVKEHPDWYLRDIHGNFILDYSTPALDSSNLQVLAFLEKLFITLDSWGFDYYKFDGEHALPLYVRKSTGSN